MQVKYKILEVVVNGQLVRGEIYEGELKKFKNNFAIAQMPENKSDITVIKFKEYEVTVRPELIWYYVVSDVPLNNTAVKH